MYLTSILWLISWPVVIWFTYKMVRIALNKYEKNNVNDEDTVPQ